MGRLLKGTTYRDSQYMEALLITIGVAIFSFASKNPTGNPDTELIGLIFLLMYISFDSFTSQWQDKIYQQYGRPNVDPYQMMLGVNTSAICITTFGLIVTGDLPVVFEFLAANPVVLKYNIITAITSASGQLCIFYTIKEFGPIGKAYLCCIKSLIERLQKPCLIWCFAFYTVFTIIMTTRQMFSICISAVVFGHPVSFKAFAGALVVL